MKENRKTKSGKSLAKQANRYELYQQVVQVPEADCRFFQRVFKKTFLRPASTLREDFCGTAAVCCEWVRSHRGRQAFGVDLDPKALNWAEKLNLSQLKSSERDRVQLVEADVRQVQEDKVDVIYAGNFSFFTFQDRESLRSYFVAAKENLAEQGLLVLDIMGGPESMDEELTEVREEDGFDYVWEHERFDPISNHLRCNIHFKFPDNSELRKAFQYDWRLWTLPEVQELLLEAGFEKAQVYWEGCDEDGEGDGVFRLVKSAPSEPSWIAYVVAIK